MKARNKAAMTAATCLVMMFAVGGVAASLSGRGAIPVLRMALPCPSPTPVAAIPAPQAFRTDPATPSPSSVPTAPTAPPTATTTPTASARSSQVTAPCASPATATATPTSTPTPTPTPKQTATPKRTPTPTPTATPEQTQKPTGKPGASTIGDAYFPVDGNGGYAVRNYFIDLTVTPKTGNVDATVIISAEATQDLSTFDLDYRGPQVTDVAVNARPASFTRSGTKLAVVSPSTLDAGKMFTVVVHYTGVPGPIRNGDLGDYGWVRTGDGAVVLAEPDGASTWFPCNDHPLNKATYIFRITVPKGYVAIANGIEQASAATDQNTTYVWTEDSPMATYLATVAIGKFVTKAGLAGRLPVLVAAGPDHARSLNALYNTTVKAVQLESSMFGPYPFASIGGIIGAPRLNYALENQERPVYAGFAPSDDFIVHEVAHQWFGDSVSLTRWSDIWLNEGFATYAEWLWNEKTGKGSAKQMFDRYLRQPAHSAIFDPPPGATGPRNLFAISVYTRGAMTLEALREKVGDPAFFAILRNWAARYRYSNATITQFAGVAKQIASPHVPAKEIDRLLNVWLYQKGKPTSW